MAMDKRIGLWYTDRVWLYHRRGWGDGVKCLDTFFGTVLNALMICPNEQYDPGPRFFSRVGTTDLSGEPFTYLRTPLKTGT